MLFSRTSKQIVRSLHTIHVRVHIHQQMHTNEVRHNMEVSHTTLIVFEVASGIKYPGCYEMTKKTTARPATITTPSTVNATNMNNEKQANEGSSTGIFLPIALVALGVTVFIVCLYIWRRRKKMFFMKKDWNRNEEESSRALEPLDTKTENENRTI